VGLLSKLFSGKKQKKPEVKKRDALSIKVGDIITYELRDFEVVGKINYVAGHYEWFDYQLLEGNDTIWLSAEMDDELELGMYKKIQLDVSKPYPEKITHEGRTYYLQEQGKAKVLGEGRSANLQGEETHYADYTDSSGEYSLGLDSWGTEIEASVGHSIEEYEIKILAGSM